MSERGIDAVLHVVVRADAAHRGERALASLPHRRRSASSRGARISSAPHERTISIGELGRVLDLRGRPSTSISSAAPASSGQSTPVAATIASIASRSIISIAAGTIPRAMIRETAAPASSVDGNVANSVRVACGLRRMRTTTSVTMPSIPSLPTTTPIKS